MAVTVSLKITLASWLSLISVLSLPDDFSKQHTKIYLAAWYGNQSGIT